MSRHEEDCRNVLRKVKQIVDTGNYVTLDTETTSLEGEVIQCAIGASNGSVLWQSYVKPTVKITEDARSIHGITNNMLKDAPTFNEVQHNIWSLIENKDVIIYNAQFDVARLISSLYPYVDRKNRNCPNQQRIYWLQREIKAHCAMNWFSTIYGEKHEYYDDYRWQKLATACKYFDIDAGKAHDATADARATALLVLKLAEMSEQLHCIEDYQPRGTKKMAM